MIDFENQIFTLIAKPLRKEYPNSFISGEYVPKPATFPAISIVEIDNQMQRNTQDTGSLENHARVTYEVNIYSNKKFGKKKECKEIASKVDQIFSNVGFVRLMGQPVDNLADSTIYRYYMRYRALINKDGVVFRR